MQSLLLLSRLSAVHLYTCGHVDIIGLKRLELRHEGMIDRMREAANVCPVSDSFP